MSTVELHIHWFEAGDVTLTIGVSTAWKVDFAKGRAPHWSTNERDARRWPVKGDVAPLHALVLAHPVLSKIADHYGIEPS